MSQAGAAFLAADGRIANHGEVKLNMVAHDSKGHKHDTSAKFEAADVTRALWSVGVICDSGLSVKFTSEHATVSDRSGKELCLVHRTNGLYIAEGEVENPNHQGFQRRGM